MVRDVVVSLLPYFLPLCLVCSNTGDMLHAALLEDQWIWDEDFWFERGCVILQWMPVEAGSREWFKFAPFWLCFWYTAAFHLDSYCRQRSGNGLCHSFLLQRFLSTPKAVNYTVPTLSVFSPVSLLLCVSQLFLQTFSMQGVTDACVGMWESRSTVWEMSYIGTKCSQTEHDRGTKVNTKMLTVTPLTVYTQPILILNQVANEK